MSRLLRALVLFLMLPTVTLAAPTPTPTPTAGNGSWTNVTANLAGQASECGNLTLVNPVPGSATVLAGVAASGLWSSSNGGESWSHSGMGSGSASITSRPSWITYDPLDPSIFWMSGIYGSGGAGIYKTTDGGTTFHPLGTITHNDFVSVDFTDPLRRTLLAGGHESSRTVYRSTDGGNTWTNIGLNLPNGTGFSSDPLILAASTYIVNTYPSYAGGSPGIYRTTDSGATWTKVSAEPANQPPLVTSSGAIFYSNGNGLVTSADSGLTWAKVGSGLLSEVRPIQIPDGRLVHLSNSTLVVSADGGSTWTPLGPTLPYTPAGVAFSSASKAFFIWHWDCQSVVLPNAIEKLSVDLPAHQPAPTAQPTPVPAIAPVDTPTPVDTLTAVDTPTPLPESPALDPDDADAGGTTTPAADAVDGSDPSQPPADATTP